MTLHLIKLCVGVTDVADFETRVAARRAALQAEGAEPVMRHLTRHTPRRRAELLAGGSLYWVVSGMIAVRTRLLAIDSVDDEDGKRCALVLEPVLVPTVPRPHRPFQGWRYLRADDAPPDLERAEYMDAAMPAHMVKDLKDLGLL